MLRSSSRMGLIPLAILALGACEVELHCLGQPGGVRRLECHATAGARGRDSLLPRLTLTRPPPGTPVLFGDTVQRRVDVQASAGPGEPTEASLATGGARLLDAHRERGSRKFGKKRAPKIIVSIGQRCAAAGGLFASPPRLPPLQPGNARCAAGAGAPRLAATPFAPARAEYLLVGPLDR